MALRDVPGDEPRPSRHAVRERGAQGIGEGFPAQNLWYRRPPILGLDAAQLSARQHYRVWVWQRQRLLNLEMPILEVMKIYPVDFDLYGFNSGSGLPD
jgi:hypothetical protein